MLEISLKVMIEDPAMPQKLCRIIL